MNDIRCLCAIDRRDLNLIKRLASSGHNFNSGVGQRKMPPVIYYAVQNNFTEAVDTLVSAGCNVNVKYTSELRTPLHVAAYIGNKEITATLCQSGANVNEVTINGETALFPAIQWTAFSNSPAIMKLLIAFGADIDVVSKNGLTPLIKAIETESLPAVRCLVESGAKIDCCNYDELKCALRKNNDLIVDYLLDVYCKHQSQSKTSPAVTPVDLCLQYSKLAAMKKAIELGFTVTAKLVDNPLIVAKTVVSSSERHYSEARFCFDYLIGVGGHQFDLNQSFSFKLQQSTGAVIINGNLLTYAFTLNCAHMAVALIRLGVRIEESCLGHYRFDCGDLDALRLLYYAGHRFSSKFESRCYPSSLSLFDRKLNALEFKKFSVWIRYQSTQPFRLSQIIRMFLRKTYGLRMSSILSTLNMPKQLISYLCFETI